MAGIALVKALEESRAEVVRLKTQLAAKDSIIRHEAEDWSEVDDALEKAGVVMSVDGYHKPQVEAVEELAGRKSPSWKANVTQCEWRYPGTPMKPRPSARTPSSETRTH